MSKTQEITFNRTNKAVLALTAGVVIFLAMVSFSPQDTGQAQEQAVKTASNTYKLEPALITSVLDVEPRFGIRTDTPQATAQHLRSLLESNNFDLVTALLAYNGNRAFVASVVKEFNSKITKNQCRVDAQKYLDNLDTAISNVQGCGFLDAPVGIKVCTERKELEATKAAIQANKDECQ
jgi:hypothetical protein